MPPRKQACQRVSALRDTGLQSDALGGGKGGKEGEHNSKGE